MTNDSIKIPVQILNNNVKLPKFSYEGDAGFDLSSSQETKILPNERKLIKCGFCIAIPKGFAGLIIPRSGLALKHGITVLNSPGLIDSGYRGEICVVLLNTDQSNTFKISVGDRIAQMTIVPYLISEFTETSDFDKTERSNKGFGSSGLNPN